ncbi:MAG: hypothetical protein Q9227_008306 [Pyrenula ochraceoflavens]
MTLKLSEVTTDAEFHRVMTALFDAYSYPYDGFWEIYKGGPSFTEQECISRFNSWRKADPTQHWVYVTDTDTDEVAGATQWNVHERSPFETAQGKWEVDWLEEVIRWCATRPSYRRRGIGRQMLSWGTSLADSLQLPCFVEAAHRAGAVPLYRSAGFVEGDGFEFDARPEEREGDQEWQRWRRELELPLRGVLMCRPAGGRGGGEKGGEGGGGLEDER